jgi:protein NEDD1
VQKKIKAVAETGAKSNTATATATTKSSTQPDLVRRPPSVTASTKVQSAKPVPNLATKTVGLSPARGRARLDSKTTVITPPTREKIKPARLSPGRTAKEGTSPQAKSRVSAPKKNILTPARDPLGNSQRGDVSACLDPLRVKAGEPAGDDEPTIVFQSGVPEIPVPDVHGSTLEVSAVKGRSRSTSAASRETTASSRLASEALSVAGSGKTTSVVSSLSARSGTGTDSRSGSPFPPLPVVPQRQRTVSVCSRTSARMTAREHANVDAKLEKESSSRTPSPDLPAVDVDVNVRPTPKFGAGTKRSGLSVLGLGTPEVDRWIAAGKGRGSRTEEAKKTGKGGKERGKEKTVGFAGVGSGSPSPKIAGKEKRNLAMQVSPRRTDPGADATAAPWAPSPLRHSAVDASLPPASSAHDFLHTIVRDVMYDFRQETRAEMVGLHLDLVRMGRGWRRELRGLMEEYVGDLRDLREENARLREENARLKRGY